MRILFLSHRLPYPPNKGDKIRSYHLLSHLSVRHEVHLICPIDEASDLDHVAALRPRVASVEYERIDGIISRLQRPLALATGEPVSVRAFHSRALQRRVDDLLERLPFDCVFAFSGPMAEYCFRSRHWRSGMRSTVKLMDLIDVDSAKWSDYAARSTGWRRWIYRREARLLADYETRIAREFDTLFLVTEAEKGSLPPGLPAHKVLALPNGVDLDFFRPAPVPQAPRVVFTGVMDYWPNVEGVSWFVREVWPTVRLQHPEAKLDIVGSKPDSRVQELAQVMGVRVTGFVPDVREYVAAGRICIAPLRIARGVQNKVLEAMAMSRAMVCTSAALEGIPAIPGLEVLVADGAAAYADAVNRLLQPTDEARRIGVAARACVEKHHRWEATLAPLDALLA
jgi:polysaccharide biosynthesis protein PslH